MGADIADKRQNLIGAGVREIRSELRRQGRPRVRRTAGISEGLKGSLASQVQVLQEQAKRPVYSPRPSTETDENSEPQHRSHPGAGALRERPQLKSPFQSLPSG